MRRGAQLSPVLTILGIFGGIALFGFVGLFVGPIILGVTKLIIEIFVQEYSGSTGVDERPRKDSDTTDSQENRPVDDGSDETDSTGVSG